MESKALRELSALYLDTVYDEGYEERNEDYDLVQKQRRQDAEARKHVARKEKREKVASKVKNVVKGFLGKEETEVREDFINKLIESGKFTEEEIQSIVDEAFKALTPDKKQAIKNQAERRKKSADRAQNASDYKTSTKQDQEVRNMKAVVS